MLNNPHGEEERRKTNLKHEQEKLNGNGDNMYIHMLPFFLTEDSTYI